MFGWIVTEAAIGSAMEAAIRDPVAVQAIMTQPDRGAGPLLFDG
jgi:hypothetical protein